MTKDLLHSVLAFITQHWRTLLILVSLGGFLLSSFVPFKTDYTAFFVFLWATATAFLLIDIRLRILKPPPPSRYPDMRSARGDILAAIRATISKSRSAQVDITLIGGRVRTITDMLRELKSDFGTGATTRCSVVFNIFILQPEFLQTWAEYATAKTPTVTQRNASYGDMINGLKAEIEGFNDEEAFKRNNISFHVWHYRENPYLYAYIIGETELFWGFFTWDESSADFHGPSNQCFRFVRGQSEYDDYVYWLRNRVEFFRNKYN